MPASSAPDPFQTQSELRATLEGAGLSPRRMFGQNFLIDRNLLNKLLDAADLQGKEAVLEVGAGTAGLTAFLAQRAGHVVAVEIDRDLFPIAAERLSEYNNVTLLNCDALERKSAVAPVVLAELRRQMAPFRSVKLVANLPYDIATSLVVNLLLGDIAFERFCFTVQTEVADRFLAQPRTPDYGPVSVVSQVFATGRRICKAPAEAFWPRPKVHSSMIELLVRATPPLSPEDARAFSSLVRRFFQHRRQTIGKIARSLPEADRIRAALERRGISLQARPEELSPEQWLAVYADQAG